MDYLNKLNPMQREAALHKDGPLLILAGAGSGKTATMTHRIAYLVKDGGVDPYNILAVTFTNKAAGEMRDRVEALIGESSGIWISTFHSACLRILRRFGDRLGYSKDFVVYDPTDQKTIIKGQLKELGVTEKDMTPAYVLSVISNSKEKAIDPEKFLAQSVGDGKSRLLYTLYKNYESILRQNNAMDFDDLLLKTVQLLERDEEVLLHYQNRFRYIMVDEYQDTNFLQYRFVSMLAERHKNICVVGDDDQCIYQWRGADIRNILDFERDFKGAKVIKLEQNYRSCANILDAAHSVILHNKGRKPKKLWTDKEKGNKLVYYRADTDKEEARFVAMEIDRLKNSERKYSDFAILYRTNTQSRLFEDALTYKGVPYRVLGGLRYYDRKEIKDMVAYMRLVQNPADDLSLERIINEPKRGIGGKTIEKLKGLASVRGEGLFQVLADPEITAGLSGKSGPLVASMIQVVSQLSEEKENLRVSDIYDSLLVQTGYLAALEAQSTVEAESRIENLMDFKSVIYDYENGNNNINMAEFLEKIALMADVDNHDADEDAVTLMTFHSAKGLEFPIVFMAGMEEGLFPGWRAFDKADGIEEERRLCYVGMTRAKERLFLTGAAMRTMYGKTDFMRESLFLRELDKNLLEGDMPELPRKKSSWADDGPGFFEPKPFYRPADSIREVKAAVQSTLKASDLKEGDRVKHAKFGEGMVLELNEKTVSIVFDSAGVKKLALGVAPLEKVN
ncbi:MAG: ATP-binding protein [Clostridiales bacterium]|nr:ATP-binding protein [Clostridiales bacterium]